MTKTETEYIEKEVRVYSEIPDELLELCPHPKGVVTYRDLTQLTKDYKSELENCNNKIFEIKKWDNFQKKQADKLNNKGEKNGD